MNDMKLYWAPHTCAIGIHVLLEEIGRPYGTERLDMQAGAMAQPEFRSINPKGRVPTLVLEDGRVLTEFGAIGVWLARGTPEAGLMPADPDEEYRALSIIDYAVGTAHGQGMGRIFKPAKFEPQDPLHGTLGLGHASVRRQGEAIVADAFAVLDAALAGRDWAAGGRFGVADAALFYLTRWAAETSLALPPHLADHLRRTRERPAVQRVMAIWGEA